MVIFRGEDLHIVKRWRNVSHQSHKEEWNLQDIVLDKVQAVDNLIIPRCMLEIEYEREKP
jgi:hypothetical protein